MMIYHIYNYISRCQGQGLVDQGIPRSSSSPLNPPSGAGRYVTGLAVRSASIPLVATSSLASATHTSFPFEATHSTALMQEEITCVSNCPRLINPKQLAAISEPAQPNAKINNRLHNQSVSLFSYLVLFSLIILLYNPVQGQQPSPFQMSIQLAEEGLYVQWLPTSVREWQQVRYEGMTLLRYQLDDHVDTLAENWQPQSFEWFTAHAEDEDGLIGFIGNILYGEEFALTGKPHDSTNIQLQYKYLISEAIYNPMVALSLGLGFLDTTVQENSTYIYEIRWNDPEEGPQYQRLSFQLSEGHTHSNSSNSDFKVLEPGEMPLSLKRKPRYELNRIEMVAKSYGDYIVLRWAPSNAVYWGETSRSGYVLFREADPKSSTLPEFLENPAPEWVFLDTLFPWSLDRMAAHDFGKDSMFLVAAQSLYGSTKVDTTDGFIASYAEANMRYGMAMYAADQSPLAADALGLRFVDKNVEPGKTYRYFLVSRAASMVLENGVVEITHTPIPGPKVESFFAEPRDQAINLLWDRLNDQEFTGYIIEKSIDEGVSYQPLYSGSLLQIQNQYSREDGFYQYLDSVDVNFKTYNYRIRGVDPFGDSSDYTYVSAAGVDRTPPVEPLIYYAETNDNGWIVIKWEMPIVEPDLEKFHIVLSDRLDGEYVVVKANLPKETREFVYEGEVSTERSYYFAVVAEDSYGNKRSTLPAFVQIIDSIPPSPPVGLRGSIDSLGIVTIVWSPNTEADLAGYRVYTANHPDHEFSQLTITNTALNYWIDTIELKALDKSVYYKVVAVDGSNNYSSFSEPLRLERPDILPPAAPAALSIQSRVEGITLEWMPSPSNDVQHYQIVRTEQQENSSPTVVYYDLHPGVTSTWIDTIAVFEVVYTYQVRARDRSGLYSELSFPLKGRRPFDMAVLQVVNLEIQHREDLQAVLIQWKNAAGLSDLTLNKSNCYIYRKMGTTGTWSKIQQTDAIAANALDRSIKKGEVYQYGIKMILPDGKTGPMKESTLLQIP